MVKLGDPQNAIKHIGFRGMLLILTIDGTGWGLTDHRTGIYPYSGRINKNQQLGCQ